MAEFIGSANKEPQPDRPHQKTCDAVQHFALIGVCDLQTRMREREGEKHVPAKSVYEHQRNHGEKKFCARLLWQRGGEDATEEQYRLRVHDVREETEAKRGGRGQR